MKKYLIVLLLIFVSIFTFTGCKDERDRKLNIDDNDIAYLSIFADNGKNESNFLLRNFGHAFLSIENVSESDFTVGDRVVKSGETITMGLWNIAEHFGVWYNVEGNYISEYNKYSHRVSLTIGISLEDINKISEIVDKSDRWTPTFNCSTFAVNIWNEVAEDSEKINDKLLISPDYLVSEITKFDGYEKNKECVTDTNVRHYKEGV